jgi:hypothetical protein
VSIDERLERIESLLVMLVQRETEKEWYSTDEFARLVGKAEFTCREWCRHGRIKAEKRISVRGSYPSWGVKSCTCARYAAFRVDLLNFAA